MNDIPRQKLKELVRRFGTSLSEDRIRCLGMLKDVCGEHRKEIAGLMAALEENIPAELMKPSISIDIARAKLSKKLEEDRGLAKEVAIWAVDTWAFALNVITESQLRSVTPITTPIPTATPQISVENPVASAFRQYAYLDPPDPAIDQNIDLGNGIKIEMVNIPAGGFEMGSKILPQEQPIHQVNIQAFCISKYAITQKQYQAVMGKNPSKFKGDNHPVEQVRWIDAKAFCRKLQHHQVRLPSEAEWEYACRAGSSAQYCFGDDENKLGEYAWYFKNSGRTTHPVGQRNPNAWGLYDMHGNVWEWCEDNWHKNYQGAPNDGSAWNTGGNQRLLRGGGLYGNASFCRSAARDGSDAYYWGNYIGFRLVCVLQ